MLRLHARAQTRWHADPVVLRVSTDPLRATPFRGREAYLVGPDCRDIPNGFAAYLAIESAAPAPSVDQSEAPVCILPQSMAYLANGDVVRISPTTGHVSVLYRRESRFNSMLLTEQCNSNCLMCSQPPKAVDDRHLAEIYMQAIPLMDPNTTELGITGGEPTLLGERLLDLIVACKTLLPKTSLHMLSNGRLFNYLSLCQDVADIAHPDLVIGIPLYSDIASRHDFVVQAHGAFDQTMRGIMNLQRCGQRVEIRVVLHRHTIDRLPQLARFLGRNLPFVEHVALMGLEPMGFARLNLDALWIDPTEYRSTLSEAVRSLVRHHMNVSIYNHQLCTLNEELWPYARKSISDWKNEYLDVCANCDMRSECGGFFSSGSIRHSTQIHPIVRNQSAQKTIQS